MEVQFNPPLARLERGWPLPEYPHAFVLDLISLADDLNELLHWLDDNWYCGNPIPDEYICNLERDLGPYSLNLSSSLFENGE